MCDFAVWYANALNYNLESFIFFGTMVVRFILYVYVQVYTFFKPGLACDHLLIAVSVTPKTTYSL